MENNLILLVMVISIIPVILMRGILGTGTLRVVKGFSIWFILSISGTMFITQSKSKIDINEQKNNNISSKIYLKNITTNLKPAEITGLKYIIKQKTMDTVSVDLLGENRVVSLDKDQDGLIYKVKTVGQDSLRVVIDISGAIEGRLTKDNDFDVKLKCVSKDQGVFPDKTQICSVSNDSQKLTLEYVKFKPDGFVDNYMWSITLEDLTLAKKNSEKESQRFQKMREEDLSKIKSQI